MTDTQTQITVALDYTGEKFYLYSHYVNHGNKGSVDWLVFKRGLIYLPQNAVKSGSVDNFIRTFQVTCKQRRETT